MGRKSMGVRPVTIRMDDAVLERIDAVMGPHQRATFVRDAVVRELERREVEALLDLLADEDEENSEDIQPLALMPFTPHGGSEDAGAVVERAFGVELERWPEPSGVLERGSYADVVKTECGKRVIFDVRPAFVRAALMPENFSFSWLKGDISEYARMREAGHLWAEVDEVYEASAPLKEGAATVQALKFFREYLVNSKQDAPRLIEEAFDVEVEEESLFNSYTSVYRAAALVHACELSTAEGQFIVAEYEPETRQLSAVMLEKRFHVHDENREYAALLLESAWHESRFSDAEEVEPEPLKKDRETELAAIEAAIEAARPDIEEEDEKDRYDGYGVTNKDGEWAVTFAPDPMADVVYESTGYHGDRPARELAEEILDGWDEDWRE